MSVAIGDATAVNIIPTVEVHLSNIYHEAFRHHFILAAVAIGQIMGFGAESYRDGLQAFRFIIWRQ